VKEPGAFLRAAIENQGEQAARLLADTEPVAAAANRLQGVRRLFIAGTGTSYHGAMVGEHLFRAAGYEAWAVPAFEFSQYPPALRPGDGLIVLSHRGTKRFSMGALQHVSGLADRWIAITGQGSPLTGAGVVQTVPQERSSVHTVSHVGALVRLAQLATHASPDLHSAWAEAMEGLPARVQSVLEDSRDPIAAQAEQIRFDRGTFFIGGGPATATALEGALKLREASFVFAEGHEVEAVLHGPLISIDAADRAVMIAEPGPSLARTQDVAAGLSAIGVRTRGPEDLARPFRIASDGLKRTDTAVHEWVGLVIYWLSGRSSRCGWVDVCHPAPTGAAGPHPQRDSVAVAGLFRLAPAGRRCGPVPGRQP